MTTWNVYIRTHARDNVPLKGFDIVESNIVTTHSNNVEKVNKHKRSLVLGVPTSISSFQNNNGRVKVNNQSYSWANQS